jgi:hypothetical protein
MEKYIQYDGITFYLDARGYYTHHKIGTLHRYVWEEHNNRKVPKGYVVHHKDEDKTNNDPANLECITDSNHKILHSTGKSHGRGYKHTEEAKIRIRAALKCRQSTSTETRLKISMSNKGKSKSEVHRHNLSIARMGKEPSNKIPTTQEMIDDKVGGMSRKDWTDKYKVSRSVWDRILKEM